MSFLNSETKEDPFDHVTVSETVPQPRSQLQVLRSRPKMPASRRSRPRSRRSAKTLTSVVPGKRKTGRNGGGLVSVGRRLGDLTLRDAADYTATILKSGFRIATRILNVEEKNLDVLNTAAVVTSTPTSYNFSLLAEGNDYFQRAGNSVGARNLRVSITVTANATVYPAPSYLRFIVFQDLECNGAVAGASTLLESIDINSAYNHVNGNRFRVLLDEPIAVISGQSCVYRRYVLPIDTDILYQGTTGVVASQYNGNIHGLAFSDAAANGPTFACFTRLTYVDN